jgi:hypothetical protein
MSAKSVCDMSCGKMHEFALALDKAGFDADMVQQVINSPGNKIARAMYAVFTSVARTDDRFRLIGMFKVVVPKGYDHGTRLDSFCREHANKFYIYNKDITDENFGQATTQLNPGRKFTVKVFQITERVTSEDCLSYLYSQGAVFVGAQGLTLAWEQKKNCLPVNRWSVSFDEKPAFFKGRGSNAVWVPYMGRKMRGPFEFCIGDSRCFWYDDACLLCFCDDLE